MPPRKKRKNRKPVAICYSNLVFAGITIGITALAVLSSIVTLNDGQSGGNSTPKNITLQYSACFGLSNQLYSHISALLLAWLLKADVVFPPAASRDSFAKRYNRHKNIYETEWLKVDPHEVWDIDALRSFLATQSVTLLEAPEDASIPDMAKAETAFPVYSVPCAKHTKCNIFNFTAGMLYRAYPADSLVSAIKSAIEQVHVPVVLNLPCTFFAIRTVGYEAYTHIIASNLKFSQRLQGLAQIVLKRMKQGGFTYFNGLHLRMEMDAVDWVNMIGSEEVVWERYMDLFRNMSLSAEEPLYVATGLFDYNHSSPLSYETTLARLATFSATILHKKMFLSEAELGGLTPDQIAAIDFLVLQHAAQFVGHGASSFSYAVREFRCIHGHLLATSNLISASEIGDDQLFDLATRLCEP